MRSWSIEGDPAVAKRYHITDKGLLYKVFGDDDYRTEYTECTVKAELTNGKVLTAGIRGYDDVNIFIRNTISDFKKTYITDKMTEYEKMEKVVRADGKVYLVTTGFGNPKPRYYQINEITRADFDKINEKNFVDPAYIWGE